MEWLTNARRNGSSGPKTIGRRLTSVRAFARWALIPHLELLEYSGPTPAPGIAHPIPEGIPGVRRLINASRHDHHTALVALGGLCGLRSAEALEVLPSNFDLQRMELKVHGKGDKYRVVPVSPEAWSYLSVPVTRAFVAGGVPVVGLQDRFARSIITNLGYRAGLERRISSHDLRATFATAVYNKTSDIRLVQYLLGHGQVTTTELYLGIDQLKLKGAVEL